MYRLIFKQQLQNTLIFSIGILALYLLPIKKAVSFFGTSFFLKSNIGFLLCFASSIGFAEVPIEFFKKSKAEDYLYSSPLSKFQLLLSLFTPGLVIMAVLGVLAHLLLKPGFGSVSFTPIQGMVALSLLYSIQFVLNTLDQNKSLGAFAHIMVLVSLGLGFININHQNLFTKSNSSTEVILFTLLTLFIFIFPGFIKIFTSWDSRGISRHSTFLAVYIIGISVLLALLSVVALVLRVIGEQ